MNPSYLGLAPVPALAFVLGLSLSSSGQTGPNISAYQVTEAGPHHRVWQRVEYETSATGQQVPHLHSYRELGTGLNYWDTNANTWAASQERIVPTAEGAAALQGQHKIFFPYNLNQGVIEMITPEGQHLLSQPLAIAYSSGTNTVIIAELRDCAGEIVGSNRVAYSEAFSGLKATLVYTYEKAKFSQDIVIQQQPQPPEAYGLDSSTTRLQVLTEFFAPPEPSVTTTRLATPFGEAEDDDVGFGVMTLARGRAMMLGTNAPAADVNKRWLRVNQRRFLLEEIPVPQIADQLSQLPLASNKAISKDRLLASQNGLPAPHESQAARRRPLELAKQSTPKEGLYWDYTTINTSQTDEHFKGDQTYSITANVYLYGNTVVEGNAVLKFAPNTSITIAYPATIQMLTTNFRPVVCTAQDDQSCGEFINGSRGTPSGYYANPAISLVGANNGQTTFDLHNFRISYANTAIKAQGVSVAVYLRDGQMVNCGTGVSTPGQAQIYAQNVLFSKFATAFNGTSASFGAQNCTFDGIPINPPNNYNPSFLLQGNMTSALLTVTNCVIANVTVFAPLPSRVSGDYNGFASNGQQPFGAHHWSSSSPFQIIGGGNYYLNPASGFQGVGTTTIEASLLQDLRQRTTDPPILYQNAAIPLSLAPQARRDAAITAVDLGYHYCPLDFAFGGCSAYANVTVAAGTALGWFRTSSGWQYAGFGINASDGIILTFNGTQVAPDYWVRLNTVQEKDSTGGYGPGGIEGRAPTLASAPEVRARFLRASMLASDANHFRDDFGYLTVRATDCEFYGGGIGGYISSEYHTNCLYDRCSVWIEGGQTDTAYRFRNCTWHGGNLSVHRTANPTPVSVRDCTFDGDCDAGAASTFPYYDQYSANPALSDYDYNGFVNCAALLVPPSGTRHDQIITGPFSWITGPLGAYYVPNTCALINNGDVTPDVPGLLDFTSRQDLAPEREGGTHNVTIGYHYVATDSSGVALDSNSDGIPNWWADMFGLDSNPLGGANGDPDGSGLSNLEEYQLGMNPLQLDGGANPLGVPTNGAAYLRVISSTLLELVLVAADGTWTSFESTPPTADKFQVTANGMGNSVTQVSFKRRPLYSSYPPPQGDIRYENTLYLTMQTAIPDNSVVQVNNTASLWPTYLTFATLKDPIRYGPAIHVNQEGYLTGAYSRRAQVGYYLGHEGEMLGLANLGFDLIDALTGQSVYRSALSSSARPDTGWSTSEAQYQNVFEADFSSYGVPGQYRLRVDGLGASLPFLIDGNLFMKFARTYALGLYHQRCGGDGTTAPERGNQLPFTRFQHAPCHTAPAAVPDVASQFPTAESISFIESTLLGYSGAYDVQLLPTISTAATDMPAAGTLLISIGRYVANNHDGRPAGTLYFRVFDGVINPATGSGGLRVDAPESSFSSTKIASLHNYLNGQGVWTAGHVLTGDEKRTIADDPNDSFASSFGVRAIVSPDGMPFPDGSSSGDNPPQIAPRMRTISSVLPSFAFQRPARTTIDVSKGHHDAGDYSKYTINSPLLIHTLIFAADNFPGVANLDNLGIPESGDGVGDVLQLAKWEADFLLKLQDTDGGFYFLVYPQTREYELDVLPDHGDSQVVFPKTTSATACAIAALAEIGSSRTFCNKYGYDYTDWTGARNPYLKPALQGWNYLANIIGANDQNKAQAYQKITSYGDDFTHDDELAWAAAAMFAATGNNTYYQRLTNWYPYPDDVVNKYVVHCWLRAYNPATIPTTGNLAVWVDYHPDTSDVNNTAGPMYIRVFDANGNMFNRDDLPPPLTRDGYQIYEARDKLAAFKRFLNNWAVTHTTGCDDPYMLDQIYPLVGLCHPTWRDGWRHMYSGYGCANRDIAFAVHSQRLTEATDFSPTQHPERVAYRAMSIAEVRAAADNEVTWSQNNAYRVSLPEAAKGIYSIGWYFPSDWAFDLAVASQLSNPSPDYLSTLTENFSYEAGRNPNNVSRITGTGWKRQRQIVSQYSQNNPLAVLPPTGIPLGSMADSVVGLLYALQDEYYPKAFAGPGTQNTSYGLYDRWGDFFNLETEFVSFETARALCGAALLTANSPAASQAWSSSQASILPAGGYIPINTPVAARLNTSLTPQEYSQAQVLWDMPGHQPAFGNSLTFTPKLLGDNYSLQAEALLPDGRRVFGANIYAAYDPIRGCREFDPPTDSSIIALYHFNSFYGSTVAPQQPNFGTSPNNFVSFTGLTVGESYIFAFGPNCTKFVCGTTGVPVPATAGFTINFIAEATTAQVWGTPGALYDGALNEYLFQDSSYGSTHYHLNIYGHTSLADNAAWMRSPSGKVVRFHDAGDYVTVPIPANVILPGDGPAPQHPVTIEARIFPRAFKSDGQSIISLRQDYNAQWVLYYDTLANPPALRVFANQAVAVDAPITTQYLTPNTWHSLRITFDAYNDNTTGITTVYIDDAPPVSISTALSNPAYGGVQPWILHIGDFDGDIDELRISNVVQPEFCQ
ncbi:MAG TPA: glycoside hydrolase family 9 protein [Verrucomicrobiae bacterium]|nr:glycoside hydrolase family 9 protein [Verrucomicrobiae bacterium]